MNNNNNNNNSNSNNNNSNNINNNNGNIRVLRWVRPNRNGQNSAQNQHFASRWDNRTRNF